MKKLKVFSKLLFVLVGMLLLLTGCGSSIKSVTDTSEKQYQYTSIDPSSLVVSYSGTKKDANLLDVTSSYVFSTPCYSGASFGVYIDEELYTVSLPNYVKATSVIWLYQGSETLPFDIPMGILGTPEDFECIISYEDGSEKTMSASYADISWAQGMVSMATVTLVMDNTTFVQNFEVEPAVYDDNSIEYNDNLTGNMPSDYDMSSEDDEPLQGGENNEETDEINDTESNNGEDADSNVDESGESGESGESDPTGGEGDGESTNESDDSASTEG